ncbi:MAG TPA: HAD-IIIC family phosphatase [Streptomyces sp.]
MSGLVKCLVWDLDNTLWRGTLLEDAEVRFDDAVRDVLERLDERGILHSVASKNDHDLAWSRLEELGVADYFVVPKIGWGPKSESVRRIAEELRFAHSTLAFVDDRPAERAEVAFHLPEVRCYADDQVLSLPGLPEFTPARTTADARHRRSLYQAGFRRQAAQEDFAGPDSAFLRTLDMELRIGHASAEDLARVEELTLRTSQMNATGVHYADGDLRALIDAPGHAVLVATLTDRFGTHGAIGVLLLRTQARVWHLKLLATSCRVVSFGIGGAVLNWLIGQAHEAGAHLVADFRRTDRNRMMDITYRLAGFTEEDCSCLGHLVPNTQDGVVRLHLVPEPRAVPDTLRLVAPSRLAEDHPVPAADLRLLSGFQSSEAS